LSERGPPIRTQAEWYAEFAYAAWQSSQAAASSGRLDEARRWLERARRLAPVDVTVRISLGVVLLRAGEPHAAATMFDEVARAHDLSEVWLGLAAARAETRDWPAAAAALSAALSHHVLSASTSIAPLATRIAREAGAAGWCCVHGGGRIELWLASRGRARCVASLDGRTLAACPSVMPPTGHHLALTRDGRPLLGSPISLDHLRRSEGFVEAVAGGLRGWAWHPGDSDRDPVLLVTPARGGRTLRVVAADRDIDSQEPMGRPRRFELPAAALASRPGMLHVIGLDGRPLAGSPLDPAAETRAGMNVARTIAAAWPAAARRGAKRDISLDAASLAVPAALRGPPATACLEPQRPIAVIVPVYRDRSLTLACLKSVRDTMPPGTGLIVVDDATPERELAASLDELAAQGTIHLIRQAANRGFPGAANAGLRAAAALPTRPDMLLLNSDAMLTAGALDALRRVVHAAPDIGTATPLSNDATILSYPTSSGGNPAPDAAARARLARLAARANAGEAVEIPTAIGFCMYIRRECLNAVGLFREDVFAQGYGEENDFCVRARQLGWRHVAAPGVFVAHEGGRSFAAAGFGGARAALMARNLATLERLHPGYHALIAAHQRSDPLAPARRRLDMARWSAARSPGRARGAAAAILITHDSGGGVERVVGERCAALRAEGLRPIVLRSVRDPDAASDATRLYLPGLCEVGAGVARDFPNLRFSLPAELGLLARLLRPDRAAFIEAHHLLGHDHTILELAGRLGVPLDIHVHDYGWFCPRISLLGVERRYCGEPANPAICEACIADIGRNDEQDIPVVSLRARSAVELGAARRVVVPSGDAANRLRRHFPDLRPEICALEDDAAVSPPASVAPPRVAIGQARRRVCVIGAIGLEKGYDVLLACARDAALRGLALEFVVIGHTIDDSRLFATGRVFVTAAYREAEALQEIRAQSAHLAFLPSVWPETWCYTLGHAWRAGLRVFAFDIGAPAERIRRNGRGWLLPLGLPPAAINNALLAARPVAGDEWPVAGSA
jgi:GT2 family glycosyltransferase/glycosyltransferase involved in cell wall biosynthesis